MLSRIGSIAGTVRNWYIGSIDADIRLEIPRVRIPGSPYFERLGYTRNTGIIGSKHVVFRRPVIFTAEEKDEINQRVRTLRSQFRIPANLDPDFLNNIEPPVIFTDEGSVFEEPLTLPSGDEFLSMDVHWNLGEGETNRYLAAHIIANEMRRFDMYRIRNNGVGPTLPMEPYVAQPVPAIAVPSIPVRNIERGTENALTFNTIEDGDRMANIKRRHATANLPAIWNSSYGRYYKRNTYTSLNPKRNPETRIPIGPSNVVYYKARLVDPPGAGEGIRRRTRRGSQGGGKRTRRRKIEAHRRSM